MELPNNTVIVTDTASPSPLAISKSMYLNLKLTIYFT